MLYHNTIWTCATLVAVGGVAGASAQQSLEPLPLNKLLEVMSVVNAREAPQWFPDGSLILFASSLGRSGVMAVSPEGGFPRAVPIAGAGAGHFLAVAQYRFSPGGEWVAYVSDASGSPEIWLWSSVDGREIQLTTHGARINAFSWSPDGRWIAFSGDRYGKYDVWKVPVPGGGDSAAAVCWRVLCTPSPVCVQNLRLTWLFCVTLCGLHINWAPRKPA